MRQIAPLTQHGRPHMHRAGCHGSDERGIDAANGKPGHFGQVSHSVDEDRGTQTAERRAALAPAGRDVGYEVTISGRGDVRCLAERRDGGHRSCPQRGQAHGEVLDHGVRQRGA